MRKIILILFLFLLRIDIYSQWIPYYLPYQGVAYSIDFYDTYKGVLTGHTFGIFQAKLFYTTNSGFNWALSSYPLEIRALPALQYITPTLVYAGGAENINKKNFNEFSKNFLKLPEHIKFTLYNIGIDGYIGEYKGVFLKSTNGGANWQKVGQFDTTNGYIMSIKFFNPNDGFAVIDSGNIGNSRVLRTTNGGINWNVIYIEPLLRLNKVEFINSNTGFVCGDLSDSNMLISINGVIFKTTNGGLTWSKSTFPFTSTITDLTFMNNNIGFAFGNGNISINNTDACTKIFKSTNTGTTWDSILLIPITIPSIIKSVVNTEIAFGAGYYYDNISFTGKITTMKTTNFGLNWVISYINEDSYITGMSLIDQNNFFMSGSFLSSQPAVIYKSTNGGVFIRNSGTNVPENYRLYQNYPNPFNQSTKIKFECNIYSNVRLIISDIQGKIITTLINSSLVPGFYELLFDSSNLTTGIYFYTLQANSYKETRKMIIAK